MHLLERDETELFHHGLSEVVGQLPERERGWCTRSTTPVRTDGVPQPDIEIDQEEGEPDQQEPESHIPGTRAGPHLVHLPIARFNSKAATIQFEHLPRGSAGGDPAHREEKATYHLALSFPPIPFDHGDAQWVRTVLMRLHRVGGPGALARAAERWPVTPFPAERNGEDEAEMATLQHPEHRDRIEFLIQVHTLHEDFKRRTRSSKVRAMSTMVSCS